jgi:four helix bundle protein
MKNFRTYQLSVEFYKNCRELKLPSHLRSQMLRAASSISLNLSEGYGRMFFKDKRKFYIQAMGSLRECQSIIELAQIKSDAVLKISDHLGACLYKLCTWVP